MDALSIAHAVGTLLCTVALGGMLFFAMVFAPLTFRALQPAAAGELLRQVFPVYYGVLIALNVHWAAPGGHGGTALIPTAALLAICLRLLLR